MSLLFRVPNHSYFTFTVIVFLLHLPPGSSSLPNLLQYVCFSISYHKEISCHKEIHARLLFNSTSSRLYRSKLYKLQKEKFDHSYVLQNLLKTSVCSHLYSVVLHFSLVLLLPYLVIGPRTEQVYFLFRTIKDPTSLF